MFQNKSLCTLLFSAFFYFNKLQNMTLKHLCDEFGTNSTTKDLNFITVLPKSGFNTIWPNRSQRDILSNQVYDYMVFVRIALQFHNKHIRSDVTEIMSTRWNKFPNFELYTLSLFLWVCFMACWTEWKALYISTTAVRLISRFLF